jgi:hypothetical protein
MERDLPRNVPGKVLAIASAVAAKDTGQGLDLLRHSQRLMVDRRN